MDLYVSAVVQQAIVEVDESGTVAAAATAAVTDTDAVAVGAPPIVAIDQPFVFLIRDIRNGSILFMGQVTDPRQGS
jgi:serpin B